MNEPQELVVTINHPAGLHMRPAALFVKTAARFQSQIMITNLSRLGTPAADAKSMFGVMLVGVSQGHQVRLRAEGPDASEALAALSDLVERQFEESA
ncbi:MAG TPA: HPr family phosphocarrier protein [Herpetosiphonaceae bacterium]